MDILTLLLPLIALATGEIPEERGSFDWGGRSLAVFRCDLACYPPKANVELSQTACDYSIFFDKQPHLRLMVPGKSRFAIKFLLPRTPEAGCRSGTR